MQVAGKCEPEREDVRARMAELARGLPGPVCALLRAYVTWLTGTRERGEVARFRIGPAANAALSLLVLAAGVGTSVLALRLGPRGWVLLVPGWILTTGTLRKLFIVVQHGFVHGALPGGRAANALATDALSVLGLLPSYACFREEHVVRHHGASFGGAQDPDAALMLRFGIRPGVPRARLWVRFVATLVSPRYHALYARTRLSDSFLHAPLPRRIVAIVSWAAVLAGAHASGSWTEFGIAWLLPAFPGFHAASLESIVG